MDAKNPQIEVSVTIRAEGVAYSPNGVKGRLMNVIARRRITAQTLDTMKGMKKAIERA